MAHVALGLAGIGRAFGVLAVGVQVLLGGAVGDGGLGAIGVLQHGAQRVVRLGFDDLRGVGVVGGHDDEGVAQVDLLEGGGDGLVKVVGLADLAAGVGVVVLLVDGSAFDLQEEALLGLRVGLQQAERLVGQLFAQLRRIVRADAEQDDRLDEHGELPPMHDTREALMHEVAQHDANGETQHRE